MSGLLFQNMAATSLVMLVVLAIRTPVARAFGARWAYALWLLPLLRLLLPPLPAFAPEVPMPSLTLIVPVAAGGASAAPEAGSWPWLSLLEAVWLAGAFAFLLFQAVAYRRFLKRLGLSARDAGAFRGLPVLESEAVEGPLAVGFVDRRIVVPAGWSCRYSEPERRLAAEHEYVHHRRGDIWWNLAALGVLALNWFNPIAWIAFRAFRADQELACDAAVAARAAPGERHAYASALVKSASRPGLISACPLNHADQLKRRLKMMKEHRHSRLRNLGGAAALVVLAGAALSLAGPGLAQPSGTQQQSGEEKQERRIVIMEHHDAKGGDAGRDHVMHFRRRVGEGGGPPDHCPEGTELANVSDTSGNQRQFFLLCGEPGQTTAQRIEALERARARIAEHDQTEAEHRARAVAAIDAAIARLRAQGQ